ncbi:hypothetical protein COMA1_20571 [Candidatus Nitrospira nitrosa]|uniref:Uncharacterized protein n=1 Tax=Candidatus Nitrospira nitrosa TaxID=1742972 RepID=A0A0S4LJ60_9BACT|nr:hypothetical protein COMA1_20571 [Candidatus Nitrospira nitrosa]
MIRDFLIDPLYSLEQNMSDGLGSGVAQARLVTPHIGRVSNASTELSIGEKDEIRSSCYESCF